MALEQSKQVESLQQTVQLYQDKTRQDLTRQDFFKKKCKINEQDKTRKKKPAHCS